MYLSAFFKNSTAFCSLDKIATPMTSAAERFRRVKFWIPNICCCFLQTRVVEKIKTSIQNSTHPNWCCLGQYSSNLITKKEPKSDNRLSKFDRDDLSPIFVTIVLLHIQPKIFLDVNKHHLLLIHGCNRADQILT